MAARGRPIEFRCIRDAHPQRCYKRTIVRSAIWNHIGSVNVNACDNGVMTRAGNLAAVVCRSGFEDLSETAREELKIRVLDSLGCAVGALEGEPVRILRRQIGEFEPQGKCTLIGGGSAAPDSAAFYNGALVRYLDFNDAYLAKGERVPSQRQSGCRFGGSEVGEPDRTGYWAAITSPSRMATAMT